MLAGLRRCMVVDDFKLPSAVMGVSATVEDTYLVTRYLIRYTWNPVIAAKKRPMYSLFLVRFPRPIQ